MRFPRTSRCACFLNLFLARLALTRPPSVVQPVDITDRQFQFRFAVQGKAPGATKDVKKVFIVPERTVQTRTISIEGAIGPNSLSFPPFTVACAGLSVQEFEESIKPHLNEETIAAFASIAELKAKVVILAPISHGAVCHYCYHR